MTEHRDAASSGSPRPSADEIRRMIARETALPTRIGYTALLVAGLAAAGITGALLLTEPGLPGHTRLAFALMAAIGLAWAVFAGWVLSRRRVLLAGHRVAAALMAVAFTTLFTVWAVYAGRGGAPGDLWAAAAAVGATLLILAILALAHACVRYRALVRRRDALEQELRGMGARP